MFIFQGIAHRPRYRRFGSVLRVFLTISCFILINKKNPKVFDKKIDEKSYFECGGIIFSYGFHHISEILIFCIGISIVNLMNLYDFEEFSSFFQDKFYNREFNSKFSNFISNYKLFGKITISHRIFYQKPSGFFL